MHTRGRRISKWWLFLGICLLLPLCLLTVPLLMGFSQAVGAEVFGPPAIWERPKSTPLYGDLVGYYVEETSHSPYGPASITLAADGTMEAHNLPIDFLESCVLSGKGNWQYYAGTSGSSPINLQLQSADSNGTCKPGGYGLLAIGGHSKPYHLYWIIGDPDSGEHLLLDSKTD